MQINHAFDIAIWDMQKNHCSEYEMFEIDW